MTSTAAPACHRLSRLEDRRRERDHRVEHVGQRAERPPRALEARAEIVARDERAEVRRLEELLRLHDDQRLVVAEPVGERAREDHERPDRDDERRGAARPRPPPPRRGRGGGAERIERCPAGLRYPRPTLSRDGEASNEDAKRGPSVKIARHVRAHGDGVQRPHRHRLLVHRVRAARRQDRSARRRLGRRALRRPVRAQLPRAQARLPERAGRVHPPEPHQDAARHRARAQEDPRPRARSRTRTPSSACSGGGTGSSPTTARCRACAAQAASEQPVGETDSEHAFCWMLEQLRAAFPGGYPRDARRLWNDDRARSAASSAPTGSSTSCSATGGTSSRAAGPSSATSRARRRSGAPRCATPRSQIDFSEVTTRARPRRRRRHRAAHARRDLAAGHARHALGLRPGKLRATLPSGDAPDERMPVPPRRVPETLPAGELRRVKACLRSPDIALSPTPCPAVQDEAVVFRRRRVVYARHAAFPRTAELPQEGSLRRGAAARGGAVPLALRGGLDRARRAARSGCSRRTSTRSSRRSRRASCRVTAPTPAGPRPRRSTAPARPTR